jgi:hypothetical protein
MVIREINCAAHISSRGSGGLSLVAFCSGDDHRLAEHNVAAERTKRMW